MKPSPLQSAIYAAFSKPSGSFQVRACAGSGKTTIIVEGLDFAPETSRLLLAFNKKIATELEQRVAGHKRPSVVKTMNALGHRAWSAAIGRRLTLDSDKLFQLTKELGVDFAAMHAVRAAKSWGIVPRKYPFQGLLPNTPETWQDLMDYYDLEPCDLGDCEKLLTASVAAAYQGNIDFDDQIYMSALFQGKFDRYDLIVVDEAQDLSPLNHEMIRKSLAPGGRLVAVGDPHQAIYGFRGADARSMDSLAGMFQMDSLPLTVSFRCPRAIVADARRFTLDIEPWAEAPEGSVTYLRSLDLASVPRGSAMVCRNNAPLFSLALRCLQDQIPVFFQGRDIGAGLKKVVLKIAPQSILIAEFLPRLASWEESEIRRKPRREGIIQDKAMSLRILAGGVASSGELASLIDRLFNSEGAKITLSSIHKAKGLEWPNVYVVDPWRIPSKYAQQEWELEQESNCAYIAATRAQENLYYINLEHIS